MAANTIAIVNSKGGAGKTTTAMALAHLIGGTGDPTILLDLDGQGSAQAWAEELADSGQHFGATVEQIAVDVPPARLARLIADVATRCEWLVIDTPPGHPDRVDAAVEAAAVYGGMCIIPTSPSSVDLPRAMVTVEDIDGRVPALVLLVKTKMNTISLRRARTELADMTSEMSFDVMEADVPERESVKEMSNLIKASGGDEATADLYAPVAIELLDSASR